MAKSKIHWYRGCGFGKRSSQSVPYTPALFVQQKSINPDWYCWDCAKAARLALAKESAPKPADVVWPKPRPISDAPTDGTPVIAYWSEQEYPRMRGLRWGVAKYGSGLVWFNEHNEPLSTPTHFLPLPPSPEVK